MCGRPAVPKIEREAERDQVERAIRRLVAQARLEEIPRHFDAVLVIRDVRNGVEEFAEAEVEVGQHQDAQEHRPGHQQDGLDDLHPGRREHAAEDHVDDHQHADADHRRLKADAANPQQQASPARPRRPSARSCRRC